MDTERTIKIARLNDELRTSFRGGSVCMTLGVVALPEDLRQRLLSAVQGFREFTEDNDPHGEHDCAALELEGTRLIWKIDYYDPTLSRLSEDPSDPEITRRVLTVMLAEEY